MVRATVTPRLRSSVAATARGAGGRLSRWLPMRPTTSRIGTSPSASAFSPIRARDFDAFRSMSSPGRSPTAMAGRCWLASSTRFWSRPWASSRRPGSVCCSGIMRAVGQLRLIRNLALVYIEFVRNTPLLVQIIFWYFAVTADAAPAAPEHRHPGRVAAQVSAASILPSAVMADRASILSLLSAAALVLTPSGLAAAAEGRTPPGREGPAPCRSPRSGCSRPGSSTSSSRR